MDVLLIENIGYIYCWTDISRKDTWYKFGISQKPNLKKRLKRERCESCNVQGEIDIKFIFETKIYKNIYSKLKELSVNDYYNKMDITKDSNWLNIEGGLELIIKKLEQLDPHGIFLDLNNIQIKVINIKNLEKSIINGDYNDHYIIFMKTHNNKKSHCYERCSKIFMEPILVNKFVNISMPNKLNLEYIKFEVQKTKKTKGVYAWEDFIWDIDKEFVSFTKIL